MPWYRDPDILVGLFCIASILAALVLTAFGYPTGVIR